MAKEPLMFVDTSVLAYAHDASEVTKQPVAAGLLASLWESGAGVLSTQILQDFYVVVTRKFQPARRLLSEDFESGRRIAGVRIVNPFL